MKRIHVVLLAAAALTLVIQARDASAQFMAVPLGDLYVNGTFDPMGSFQPGDVLLLRGRAELSVSMGNPGSVTFQLKVRIYDPSDTLVASTVEYKTVSPTESGIVHDEVSTQCPLQNPPAYYTTEVTISWFDGENYQEIDTSTSRFNTAD